MGKIIEQGTFYAYSQIRLDEAKLPISEYSYFFKKTTVFVSHKHDELQELKGVLGFLQNQYGVKTYIDSQDSTMPIFTSEETARILKDRIKRCDKFILLATNAAIESKWCNWELGYGDAQKYKKHIALLPIKPHGSLDSSYKGAEYLLIYPYICYEDGTGKDDFGKNIPRGYYVEKTENGKHYYQTLSSWFLET